LCISLGLRVRKLRQLLARRYLLKSSGGHDDDVIEVSGPAPKRRGNMGSALGSSSMQTPATFMFECGIPFKTPGTQHGMRCGMQCGRRGLGCAHSPPTLTAQQR